jgi:hypothetical protein
MPQFLPWIIFSIALLVPQAKLHGQSATQNATQEQTQSASKNPLLRLADNGVWWNTLTPESKSDFVDGYVSGMATVRQDLLALLKEETKALSAKGDVPSHLGTITYLSLLAERYDFTVNPSKLVTGVDAFYKDSQNKFIKTVFAFQYVRDTLNGKVAPRDLEKQLNEWRETFNKPL